MNICPDCHQAVCFGLDVYETGGYIHVDAVCPECGAELSWTICFEDWD